MYSDKIEYINSLINKSTNIFGENNQHSSECWLWSGWKYKNGYGGIKLNQKMLYAHRVVYEVLVGNIPTNKELDHLCRNRLCVNPRHLEPVSRKENLHRSPIHNTNKTHCPKGHKYSKDNTFIEFNGSRKCIICRRTYGNKIYLGNPHNRDKTHCIRGHEFTESNTYIMKNGGRTCKACRKVHNQRRKK